MLYNVFSKYSWYNSNIYEFENYESNIKVSYNRISKTFNITDKEYVIYNYYDTAVRISEIKIDLVDKTV